MNGKRAVVLCLIVMTRAVLGVSPARADDWPQFRGPNSAGVAKGRALPTKWSENSNVRWKRPIPGLAWSSPIIAKGRVYLTNAVPDKPQEKPKGGLYFGGDRYVPREAVYRWQVLCLDLASGSPIWQREVHVGKPNTPIHLKNTYASETPVSDGEHIYAYFGAVGLYCLDLSGAVVWEKNLGAFKTMMGWGTGSSPILFQDKVFIQYDNEENSFLIAFDKRTGAELWRQPRKEGTSWSTPFLWKNPLRTELVASATRRIRSYDPATGKLFWELGRNSVIACPTAVAGPEFLYVSSGYVMDPVVKPIYAVKPGASGDLTLKTAETSNAGVAWSQRFGGAYMPSPLFYDGRLYVLYDMGFLACYDGKTGAAVYSKQRLGAGSQFTASPWSCSGRIFCLAESGVAYVEEAGPKFSLVGANRLEGMFLATPAVADGKLILRSDAHLYCIEDANAAK